MAHEIPLVESICELYGVLMETARVHISTGRKVGFIVSHGKLPQSSECFASETPTPSSAAERNMQRKSICLIPDGFKMIGVVDGCVYMGECLYDRTWKRCYRFHLFDGQNIIVSSAPCKNPTSAFKEIEAVLKTEKFDAATGQKKKCRKQDARSNGKLYMGVMYSAVQNILRSEFSRIIKQGKETVPDSVKDKFFDWLAGDIIGENNSVSLPIMLKEEDHDDGPSTMIMEKTFSGFLDDDDEPMLLSKFHSFTIEDETTLDSSSLPSLYQEKVQEEEEKKDILINMMKETIPLTSNNSLTSTTTSNSSLSSFSSLTRNISRKRSVDTVVFDQITNNLIKKRTSESDLEDNHEDSRHLNEEKEEEVFNAANNLFLDCFQIKMEPLQQQQQQQFVMEDEEEDTILPSAIYHATSATLFELLKEDELTLSIHKIQSALSSIFQIPKHQIPRKLIEESYKFYSNNSFKTAFSIREREIMNEFHILDKDCDGVISLKDLQICNRDGLFGVKNISDVILEELLVKMDHLSLGVANHYAWDRRIQFEEFRTMLILLPPKMNLNIIIQLVQKNLRDRENELLFD